MRRVETRIRQVKDTATLARYAGDDVLRKQCQRQIGILNEHYKALSRGAGLKPEYQRTYVAGFRDAKDSETLTGRGIGSKKQTEERIMANGLCSQPRNLTEKEIQIVREAIRRIGTDESVFVFNRGSRTSYDDDADCILIKGNVFPDLDSRLAVDRISVEVVLAHEYYGHRANRGTKLPKR